jgi:hypothetical protein
LDEMDMWSSIEENRNETEVFENIIQR